MRQRVGAYQGRRDGGTAVGGVYTAGLPWWDALVVAVIAVAVNAFILDVGASNDRGTRRVPGRRRAVRLALPSHGDINACRSRRPPAAQFTGRLTSTLGSTLTGHGPQALNVRTRRCVVRETHWSVD